MLLQGINDIMYDFTKEYNQPSAAHIDVPVKSEIIANGIPVGAD